MTTLPLADGIDTSLLWVYLILAAVSVIGAIFGKKKQEQQKRKEREAREAGARRRAPAAPAAPRPPQPPRPVELERPSTRITAPGRLPEARPARARPIPPVPRPVEARPRTPVRRPPVWRPAREVTVVLQPELEPVEVEPTPVTVLSGMVVEPAAAEERREVRPAVQVRRVERLLRHKQGLRTAIVLSEILAPPVALRENHHI